MLTSIMNRMLSYEPLLLVWNLSRYYHLHISICFTQPLANIFTTSSTLAICPYHKYTNYAFINAPTTHSNEKIYDHYVYQSYFQYHTIQLQLHLSATLLDQLIIFRIEMFNSITNIDQIYYIY